ncbi:MAG: amino acid ABC transporter ATP-binding protein [Bdellovibrionales bacterium]
MVVSIANVRKSFQGREVVRGISLDVSEGDLVALIGPSGCGKSTLLRCINGLESVTAGEICTLETTLKSPDDIGWPEFNRRAQVVRRRVGMVFQSFNLFPHLTVLQNLMKAPQVVNKVNAADAEGTAMALLKKVALEDKADHYPHEISGGQQQRAAIARALAMTPKLMLYDEPTSALDPTLVNEVLGVMKQLDNEGMTQIVVTHEMRFAREVADRIVFIDAGEIVETGPPDEIFGTPKDERTRTFLRNFL